MRGGRSGRTPHRADATPADLTREFFDALGGAVGDAVMLMVAEEDEPGGGGEIVAGALNLVGSDALFGRNWGCRSERPFLHMELCYYQARARLRGCVAACPQD